MPHVQIVQLANKLIVICQDVFFSTHLQYDIEENYKF
jgi:hypothetical protein